MPAQNESYLAILAYLSIHKRRLWANTLTFNNISVDGSLKYSLIISAYMASKPTMIPTTKIILNQKCAVPTIVNGVYSMRVPVQKLDIMTYIMYNNMDKNVKHTKLNHVQYFV